MVIWRQGSTSDRGRERDGHGDMEEYWTDGELQRGQAEFQGTAGQEGVHACVFIERSGRKWVCVVLLRICIQHAVHFLQNSTPFTTLFEYVLKHSGQNTKKKVCGLEPVRVAELQH